MENVKNEKGGRLFLALMDYLGLRHDEAVRIIEDDNPANAVLMPLPVVYVKDGRMEALSHLYLHRKDEIWGVLVDDLVVELIHRGDSSCVEAASIAEQNEAYVPSLEEMRMLYDRKHKFDFAVAMLQENGVEAEKWKDGLYCLDVNESGCFNMETRFFDYDSLYSHLHVRLIRPIHKKA